MPKLYIWVHDYKTIGKDKEIGEGEIEVIYFVFPASCNTYWPQFLADLASR